MTRAATFALPIGSAFSGIGHAMTRMGFEAFVTWVSTEGTEDEIEVIGRLLGYRWQAEGVEPGNREVLEGLLRRLPARLP